MKEITLDECINPALRVKIKKLVELNLDVESIWDLLDPNLRSYEDFMYAEVEKYVKYVLWLRETCRSLENAYEKYKNYTQNYNRNFKRDLATRLELEEKRRDQQRIDELSALMRFSRTQKDSLAPNNSPTDTPIIKTQESDNPVVKEDQKPEISESKNEIYQENEEEDTESDLDFIDLSAKSKDEATLNLDSNDLLFETMSSDVTPPSSDITLGLSTSLLNLEEEKTLTLSEVVNPEGSKTNEALMFYEELEDKYGTANIEQIPISAYELGAKVSYQDQKYQVIKVETISDFFNKPEIVVTLKNLKDNSVIHVNHKQLTGKK